MYRCGHGAVFPGGPIRDSGGCVLCWLSGEGGVPAVRKEHGVRRDVGWRVAGPLPGAGVLALRGPGPQEPDGLLRLLRA